MNKELIENVLSWIDSILKFKSAFPDIDVHKNSMGTLLYYPKSLKSLEK